MECGSLAWINLPCFQAVSVFSPLIVWTTFIVFKYNCCYFPTPYLFFPVDSSHLSCPWSINVICLILTKRDSFFFLGQALCFGIVHFMTRFRISFLWHFHLHLGDIQVHASCVYCTTILASGPLMTHIELSGKYPSFSVCFFSYFQLWLSSRNIIKVARSAEGQEKREWKSRERSFVGREKIAQMSGRIAIQESHPEVWRTES